ncbi:MAG: DUF4349 domain-containing protein [Deltaproteobacteria bacterium]|nr:DUF4349 domain-containing protein [Deltaproteobacteria bacterium]
MPAKTFGILGAIGFMLLAQSCAAGAMSAKGRMMAPMGASAQANDYSKVSTYSPVDAGAKNKVLYAKQQATGETKAPAEAPKPRQVVYTGSYTVDVYEMQAAAREWITWAEKVGGYMEQTNGNRITVRVPAEHFSEAEGVLRNMGRIDDQQTRIQAEDVTARYVDMDLRLKSKKNYLAQLQKLQESAGELKDKLAVQQEIARVLEEIEAMEGQLRLLAKKISLATIHVTFRLATAGPKRQFNLPWEWLDMIGLERLLD